MSNVISLGAKRAEREGWETVNASEVDWKVYDLHNGLAYVGLVTGSAARDDLHVAESHLSEDALSTLIEKATQVRDQMRARRDAV